MLFRRSSSTNNHLLNNLCIKSREMKNVSFIFFLSVVSCPQEAIVTQIVKSLVTNLQQTLILTLGHHTVIAGAVRNETSKENWPIGVLPQGDTLQSV